MLSEPVPQKVLVRKQLGFTRAPLAYRGCWCLCAAEFTMRKVTATPEEGGVMTAYMFNVSRTNATFQPIKVSTVPGQVGSFTNTCRPALGRSKLYVVERYVCHRLVQEVGRDCLISLSRQWPSLFLIVKFTAYKHKQGEQAHKGSKPTAHYITQPVWYVPRSRILFRERFNLGAFCTTNTAQKP